MTSPRAQWERWQREGRPTLGSRKPLLDYLVDNARWHAEVAFVAEAKGARIPAEAVAELDATVQDLARLCREQHALGAAWRP